MAGQISFETESERQAFALAIAQTWLAPSVAGRVLSACSTFGLQMDSGKVRRWIKEGRFAEIDVETRHMGEQWWVSTEGLLGFVDRERDNLTATIDQLNALRAEGGAGGTDGGSPSAVAP